MQFAPKAHWLKAVKCIAQWLFASGASGPSGSDTPQSTAALRKELQEAQSQAAQEAGHVAQFKSLAESAEENTSIIQVELLWHCLANPLVILAFVANWGHTASYHLILCTLHKMSLCMAAHCRLASMPFPNVHYGCLCTLLTAHCSSAVCSLSTSA